MRKSFHRITIVLLVVILLPVAFYFIKQLNNLSDNEKIVKNVFDKQLETILFTLNQNSENIIANWTNKIDLPPEADSTILVGIVNNLLQNNQAIHKIELITVPEAHVEFSLSRFNPSEEFTFRPGMDKIQALQNMLKDGYQRIESASGNSCTILFFMLKNRGKDIAAIIYLNTKTFIEQNLGANFQTVAQEAFNIKIINKSDNKVLYSVGDDKGLAPIDAHKQDAWYLPGIEFSIKLRAATIDSLTKERSQKDNITLFALLIIVLFGVAFLIQSIRKEINLAEIKSEFVSNVSHEIRTPLALIRMYSETLLLKRFKTPEKEKEYLNVIFNESNRLSEMVSRILSFSKMEKMKRTYHFSDVDINSLVDEVVYTFSPHLKSLQVECIKNLDASIPLIHADSEAITECLINLIDNAIKYGKDTDKKIWIHTFCDNSSCFINVEDNGIGIAKKHLPYIFDKFYRVTKGNLAHQAKGTGIGLNIVSQIMIAHKGKVKVKSKPGEGSTFTLQFQINN